MATRVTLTPSPSDADHTIHVAKVRLTNDRGDREAEAAWLERAARPGVVRLVATSEEPFTIVTEHVGSRTLRTAGLDPDDGLATTIGLCDLLIELHRDGIVHGKLTPDHVIVGGDRIWLCSPDGRADDPGDDLVGLARCMTELEDQWHEAGEAPVFLGSWRELAARLVDDADPARSATRARSVLQRFAVVQDDTDHNDGARRGLRHPGLGLAALAVGCSIGGLALLSDETPAFATDAPRIESNGSVYAVGSAGDDVVLLETACDASPPVVLLDTATDIVWAFDEITDGASARPVAVVPGATDLRSEWVEAEGCSIAVARGPAGVSVIRTTDD